jgi:hypothetical protein
MSTVTMNTGNAFFVEGSELESITKESGIPLNSPGALEVRIDFDEAQAFICRNGNVLIGDTETPAQCLGLSRFARLTLIQIKIITRAMEVYQCEHTVLYSPIDNELEKLTSTPVQKPAGKKKRVSSS